MQTTARKVRPTTNDNTRKIRPALTPEAEENQMISLAIDLAKKQLLDGTASSQVITHYLQLGSTKRKLEDEIKEQQKELLVAKTDALKSAKTVERLYNKAIEAMKSYSGNGGDDYNDEETY